MKKVLVLALWMVTACLCAQDRRPSAPYITGDGFRAYAQHLFDETSTALRPEEVKEGDVVFVKSDFIETFFTNVHPRIEAKYILITHNSDCPCPGKCAAYLNDDKLIAWLGQNAEGYVHPKLHPIPIGLENRYNSHGDPGLIERGRARYRDLAKTGLLYMNFTIGTRPDERSYVYRLFQDKTFCLKSPGKKYDGYLKDLAQAKFVLSPRGNGLDCHRTWEALYMGAIPIVKASTMDAVFSDLPVLIVDDWSLLTEELLQSKWEEMSKLKVNREKLFMQYWHQFIDSLKSSRD